MLLLLQKYSLQVKYKKGKDMNSEVNACAFTRELEDIDHHSWLPMFEDRWQELKNAAADVPIQRRLRARSSYKASQRTEQTYPRSCSRTCATL